MRRPLPLLGGVAALTAEPELAPLSGAALSRRAAVPRPPSHGHGGSPRRPQPANCRSRVMTQ